jgi:hypothetical protein
MATMRHAMACKHCGVWLRVSQSFDARMMMCVGLRRSQENNHSCWYLQHIKSRHRTQRHGNISPTQCARHHAFVCKLELYIINRLIKSRLLSNETYLEVTPLSRRIKSACPRGRIGKSSTDSMIQVDTCPKKSVKKCRFDILPLSRCAMSRASQHLLDIWSWLVTSTIYSVPHLNTANQRDSSALEKSQTTWVPTQQLDVSRRGDCGGSAVCRTRCVCVSRTQLLRHSICARRCRRQDFKEGVPAASQNVSPRYPRNRRRESLQGYSSRVRDAERSGQAGRIRPVR